MSSTNLNLRYQDTYQEGTWLPLASWIESVNGPVSSPVTDQLGWAKSVGATIQWDCGKPGVVVLDHHDGRKRVRVGQASSRATEEESTWGIVLV